MRGRVSLIIAAVILTFLGVSKAEDYVEFDDYGSGTCMGQLYAQLNFRMFHDSEEPNLLTSGSNGFVVTGGIELVDIVPDPAFPGEISCWILDDDGLLPDTFVVEFTSAEGIPSYHHSRAFFTLIAHYTGGEVYFDSTWVSPTYEWSWSGPGATVTPGFVSEYYSESPIVVEPWEGTCIPPDILVLPEDNQLVGFSGCELSFEFYSKSVWDGLQIGWILFSIPFGPGSMTTTSCSSAVYTCPPMPAGTYSVLLEANMCCGLDYYEFDVVFLSEEPPLGDCDCSGDVDIDDVVYLIAYIFSGGPEPYANPDCQGEVDIDDVVYLIYYIFSSGPAPCG